MKTRLSGWVLAALVSAGAAAAASEVALKKLLGLELGERADGARVQRSTKTCASVPAT